MTAYFTRQANAPSGAERRLVEVSLRHVDFDAYEPRARGIARIASAWRALRDRVLRRRGSRA